MLWKKFIAMGLILLTLCLVSCGNGYTCIVDSPYTEEEIAPPSEKLERVTIGDGTFALQWISAEQNNFTGEIIDRYKVANTDFDYVNIERESGRITSFHGFSPFALPEDVNEECLREAVEKHFSDIDFKDFDAVSTSQITAGKQTVYKWEKENENVSLTVYVDEDGKVYHLHYINAPAGEKLIISDDIRDKMIVKALKKADIWERGMTVTAELTYYTQYMGKNAILYQVQLVDSEGFSHGVHPVIISE